MMANRTAPPDTDRPFRQLLIIATALALAVMIASVASIRTSGAGLQFVWHWSVLIWSALGGFCAWPFWRFVWAVQVHPTRRNKFRLALFCLLIVGLGVAGFLYPLRYTAPAYRNDLLIGLVCATLVLSAVGAMIFFLGRAFSQADSKSKANH